MSPRTPALLTVEYHRPHRGYDPGRTHRHDWHELIVLERGAYRAVSASGPLALQAGQWVFWPAGMQHTPDIAAADPQRDAYYYLAWKGPGIPAASADVGRPDPQRRLLSGARWLYDASHRVPQPQDLLDGLLRAFLAEARWLTTGPDARGDDRLERARHFMLEHLGKDISVPEMALAVGMSSRHFERRFKERYGASPKAYLLRLREERVLDLLVSTDLPLDEIASHVSMPGASYLCRRIRQATGRTPGAIRTAASSSTAGPAGSDGEPDAE